MRRGRRRSDRAEHRRDLIMTTHISSGMDDLLHDVVVAV
jgi:hypothetical protein